MYTNINYSQLFTTKTFSNESDWLNFRNNGIGGSECSAILGLNPHMTNTDLWREKALGIKSKQPNPDVVNFGKEKESELFMDFKSQYGERFEVTHKDFDLRISNKFSFMFGSLDGELTDRQTGKKGILEIKTAKIYWHNRNLWGEDFFPMNYYCQLLHYMSVTGFDYAILYARLYYTDGEEETKMYFLNREKFINDIKNLEKKEEDFWNNHVLTKQQPDLLVTRKVRS